MTSAPTASTHRVLARVEANLVAVRRAEFERLVLAREWALAHVVTDPEVLADPRRRPTLLGAVGLPVDEYAGAEFAAALALHPLAGRRWLADAVDIYNRLPSLWATLAAGRVEVWVARKIAAATADLTDDQAQWVDAAVAEVVGTLPPARLLALVAARVVQADQALAERKAEQAACARMVWTSRPRRARHPGPGRQGHQPRHPPTRRHHRPPRPPAGRARRPGPTLPADGLPPRRRRRAPREPTGRAEADGRGA